MLKKVLYITAISQLVLTFVQFGLTFGRATDGDKLVDLEVEIAQLSQENNNLRTQIQFASTIENIRSFAIASNMLPAQISGLDPLSVAARQENP